MENLIAQRRNLLGQFVDWEVILDRRPLNDERKREDTLFLEYEEFVKNVKISWRQRSRTQWLKEGDKNIKFIC